MKHEQLDTEAVVEPETIEEIEPAEKVETSEEVEPAEKVETSEETETVEEAETVEEVETVTEAESTAAELASLREQLSELRGRFERQRAELERMSRECDEFSELYPDRPLTSLPREVWDNVREGIPLAAAYAYSEARREHALRRAEAANERNAQASSGDVVGQTVGYFSPAEVREMTAAEVRSNYKRIMDSMKLWS